MAEDQGPETPLQRLDRIDTALAALRSEVFDLKREMLPQRIAAHTASVAAPAPPTPASAPSTTGADERPSSPVSRRQRPGEGLDFENLVGRYGTVAVATIAIMLGVGAFLQWAIARGMLGPRVRVLLGALAAIAIAGLGARLRRTGALRFGNVLLAIALAIVHLDAWAAGPGLDLVAPQVALAVATVASVALALLAISDGQQALFSIGVGGTLLAPFVTSTGSGSTPQLLAFGWLVLTAAIVALREPLWVAARTVVVSGAGVYASAAMLDLSSEAPARTRLPAIFLLAVAVSAIVVGDPKGRRVLASALLGLLVLTLLATTGKTPEPVPAITLALLGTIAVHVLRRRGDGVTGDRDTLFQSMVLPLGFFVVARLTISVPTPMQAALIAAPWTLVSYYFGRTAAKGESGPHYAVAWMTLMAGVFLAAVEYPVLYAISASLIAIGVLFTLRMNGSPALLLPLAVALLASTAGAYDLLQLRPRFDYLPFLTKASLAALFCTAAWVECARAVQAVFGKGGSGVEAGREWPDLWIVQTVAITVGLLWGHFEFARAFSADQATFLLITYYAIAGVVMIGIGRSFGRSGLRKAGIALAILGAAKAVLQASDLDNVALRIAAYLLVGTFLLGVGYWYRAGASTADAR